MRLSQLVEQPTLWYHGTPEINKFNGVFEPRYTHVSYISDVELWNELQDEAQRVEWNSDEYHSIMNTLGSLRATKRVRAPVYFSNNKNIALTYANTDRAFDYQDADAGIIVATINGDALSIQAHGAEFRGIPASVVYEALQRGGYDDDEITGAFDKYSSSIGGNGHRLSTDLLVAIIDEFPIDLVDVVGIKDAYQGGGPNSTIRMVFDTSTITVADTHVLTNR